MASLNRIKGMRFVCHRWSHFATPVKHRVIPTQFIMLIHCLLDRFHHLPSLGIVQIWLPAVSQYVELIRSGPEEHPEPLKQEESQGLMLKLFQDLRWRRRCACVRTCMCACWPYILCVVWVCPSLCLIWPSSLSCIPVLTQCTGNRKEGNRNTLDLKLLFQFCPYMSASAQYFSPKMQQP